MLLIFRQALWRNPWCLFFRFEEKYDDAVFTSDPVFLSYSALSYVVRIQFKVSSEQFIRQTA